MKQRFYLLLAVIVIIAAVLRLANLGQYPQRFNQDEMAQGYDAWSIWSTGHDQHGEFLPLQFRNFNDYVPPVGNYLTAPIVGLLGLDETTTRLPAALFGIATIAVVGLLGRLWFGELAGLIAALLLTFEPWHLNYSRIAFPASFVPFFTVVALYTYTRGIALLSGDAPHKQRRSLYWLAASALSFAILTATYSTMKLEAPLLIGACLVSGIFVWWRNWRVGLLWLLLMVIFISPFAFDQITHWQQTQGRFDSISVFRDSNWQLLLWKNYLAHYDLQAFFVDGLKEGVAVHPDGIGELFWLEAPLLLVALVGFLRGHFWSRSQLLIPLLIVIWFLTFPLAASLTNKGIPHEIRTINLLPLPELLAGYGFALIWEWGQLGKWRRGLTLAIIAPSLLLFILFNVTFLTYFFAPSLLHIDPPNQEVYDNIGLRPVLEKVQSVAQPCDIIWMQQLNQPYIYYLFLTRTPPEQFQKARIQKNPELWLNIKWFNNIRFGIPDETKLDIPTNSDCDAKPSQTYFITRLAQLPQVWQDIMVIRNDAGDILWRAAVKMPSPN